MLLVIAVSQLMIVLDGTVVNVALPTAQHDLGFGDDLRQWVVTAYALAFGALLLLGGRLTSIFRTRTIFIIGLVGFAVASVVGGLATGFVTLVIGRALQGVFAALLAPAALSLLAQNFTTPQARARAFGVFGAVAGGGAAVGLVLGGLLTEYISWRWCLLINLVFAAVATAGALVLIRPDTAPVAHRRVDALGAVLITVGLGGVVFGLSSAETNGWGSVGTIAPLIAGVLVIAAFVFVETRAVAPLLPLRVVLNRNRAGAYLVAGLVSLALFSVFLFLTYYLQSVKGYTPLQTGLAFLPLPVSIGITSVIIGPRLLARFGPKVLLVAGPLIASGALLLFSSLSLSSTFWGTIVPGLLLLGLGLGQVFSAAPNVGTTDLEAADLGVGSALVNTAQQIGGAVGTALLSVIATTTARDYLADHETTAGAAVQAQLASYQVAFLTSSGILLGTAVLALLLVQRQRTRRS